MIADSSVRTVLLGVEVLLIISQVVAKGSIVVERGVVGSGSIL
jgi:hypothetical protein